MQSFYNIKIALFIEFSFSSNGSRFCLLFSSLPNSTSNNEIYSLYLLYKDIKYSKGYKLPDFIDRGKAYEKLVHIGFAEKVTEKHIHDTPYSITSEGINFLSKLEEAWDLSFIEETPLDDKNKFDNFFMKELETDQNQCEYKTFDDILSLFIQTPLNQKVSRNGVDLVFLGYREIENNGQKFEYLFCFKVICNRCDNNLLFKQNINFDSNKYSIDPSIFNSECPVCKRHFHMNAYISEWWFD